MSNILIVDDEETFLKNTAKFLARAGHSVDMASSLKEGMALAQAHPPDAIVLDYRLPDGTGLELIQRVRATDAQVPIVLITGHGTIELAVEAMKAGATDLLTKPVSLRDLSVRLETLLQTQRDSGRLQYLEARERSPEYTILGTHASIEAMQQRITRIAQVDGDGILPPILITGETGTGKELVARACHFQSTRAHKAFIEINCAAIPSNLLETEVFGHERGAFTDAKERRIGLLEAANGGSLFLDEIGDMELSLQAKLLKVIEDGRFRRVGAVQERQVNVRLIAATNQDLENRVAQGLFRADLYFRLRVLQVPIPPLRERGDDALLLARHFCQVFAQRYRKGRLALDALAELAIRQHSWPGNVRELRNVMEQAVLLASSDNLHETDLMLPASRAPAPERLPSERPPHRRQLQAGCDRARTAPAGLDSGTQQRLASSPQLGHQPRHHALPIGKTRHCFLTALRDLPQPPRSLPHRLNTTPHLTTWVSRPRPMPAPHRHGALPL